MKGCLITFIGPSGVGKTEILNQINKIDPDLLCKAISATTRNIRSGEINGEDMHFKTKDEFLELIEKGKFMEFNTYAGDYYGTSFSSILPLIDSGKKVIKIIDVNGLKSVKDSKLMEGKTHISIFINAPSKNERERRIRTRGILPEEEIKDRISIGDDELKFFENNKRYFDHFIINDNLSEATKKILEIIRTL